MAVDAQGKFAWTGKGCVREKDQPSKQANHTYCFHEFPEILVAGLSLVDATLYRRLGNPAHRFMIAFL